MKRTTRFTALLLSAFMMVSLTGCGDITPQHSSIYDAYPNEEGYAEGQLGYAMHTYFFDYIVNSAYICERYESYSPKEGHELLVADVCITNTSNEPITMYDTDFQVQWNDDAEDAFNVPITYYADTDKVISKALFPYEYSLKRKESRTGLLVFEIPKGMTEFSISYLEYFDDDSTGNVFFVYFSAEKQTQ